jgi:lipopolysaccharide/colanic/teichoic acid biosynthesis glycosyltransferase
MNQVNRTRIIFAVSDVCLVYVCIFLSVFIHDDFSLKPHPGSYLAVFLIFPLPWLLISLLTRKFRIGERSSHREVLISIIFSNFVILSFIAISMVLFQLTYFSRFILFVTITSITFFEILAGSLYVSIHKSVFLKDWIGLDIPDEQHQIILPRPIPEELLATRDFGILRDSMIEEIGENAFTWICSHVDINDPKSLIISTDSRFNIINHPASFYFSIVNIHQINDLRRINKFFETVNAKLPPGGIFIGCGETITLRKQRVLAKFPPGINYVFYSVDFILNRVFPKLILTRKLYFLVTGGKKRVISRTETLGRLYSCGFEIVEEKTMGNLLYWKTCKIRAPFYDTDPTYGIFIRLRRIGKNGKEFNVYKLRTMHAFAEYLQTYVYDNNQLDDRGKFKDDFRVTTLGRIFRKFWLDELPMLLNIMKGDMKLVGIRPLSRHYFNLYSEELQKKRIKVKPGLIPPYYAQFPTPGTIEEVQQNEMEYLAAFEKHPFMTDIKYFFRAMYNILWNKARSK